MRTERESKCEKEKQKKTIDEFLLHLIKKLSFVWVILQQKFQIKNLR